MLVNNLIKLASTVLNVTIKLAEKATPIIKNEYSQALAEYTKQERKTVTSYNSLVKEAYKPLKKLRK